MNILVVGAGYVGLVTALCLGRLGHQVRCVDNNAKKIRTLQGWKPVQIAADKSIDYALPFSEPGLFEAMEENFESENVTFGLISDLFPGINQKEVVFFCVGTPFHKENKELDLSPLKSAIRTVAQSHRSGHKTYVIKSTVPVGACHQLIHEISSVIANNSQTAEETTPTFDLVFNPEFLAEGRAFDDFMNTTRLIFGVSHIGYEKSLYTNHNLHIEKTGLIMAKVYDQLPAMKKLREDEGALKIVWTSHESAEMIKLASNGILATKVTFMNIIAEMCQETGANVDDVRLALSLDNRIGKEFLNPGPGFGGSCFPKDVLQLAKLSERLLHRPMFFSNISMSNYHHTLFVVEQIKQALCAFVPIHQAKIAVLGLSFKPDTDDVRHSPAIDIIGNLLRSGAYVQAHDPNVQARENFHKAFPMRTDPKIKITSTYLEACADAHIVVVLTEWDEYKRMPLNMVKNMVQLPILFDTRNIYLNHDIDKTESVKRLQGFTYFSMGRKAISF